MKSEALLDSVVFQLTPTRTRCDLVIKANGKTEKIATGLLNPFLDHLKTAKDQIAKGGYSIILEPELGADAPWFTKGTVERFVRFVSTPEVLERVNTIESEIFQIEEGIAMQGNEILQSSSVEEDQSRSVEHSGGSKSVISADAAKAIVLYKPGTPAPESSGLASREENSKVQLLRVLETRKTVLQKEQGMAFARAAAAGFTVENIAYLISFAECFGAVRMLEACSKFMDLYNGKHETGQWLEIEAADAMSMRSEFTAMNTSEILLSADIGRQREHREQWPAPNNDLNEGNNGKVNGGDMNSDLPRDTRINGESKAPGGPNEYFQGQYPHPMFPQWPVHSPGGVPVFQPYTMQGMPFYQNYPAGGPYFPPPYAPVEDPTHHKPRRTKSKKRSSDSKSSTVESESHEMSAQSQDDDDNTSDLEKEASVKRESRRKSGRSGKKQSGMVVIKNLNYIASKKHNNASGSESCTASDSENEGSHSDTAGRNERNRKSSRSSKSKRKGDRSKYAETEVSLPNKEEARYGQELDSGSWEVFQNFLLRDEEKGVNADSGMFSSEKKPAMKRQESKTGEDPILPIDRDFDDSLERKMHKGLNDHKFYLDGGLRDDKQDVPFEEIEGGSRGYRKGTSEDFVVYRQDKVPNVRNSSDPIAENEYAHANSIPKGSLYNASDESFIIPMRLGSPEQNESASRTAIVMDSEFPSAPQEFDSSNTVRNQLNYEPDDLSLMPEQNGEPEDSTGILEELKKKDKEKKSKALQDGSEKKKMESALGRGRLTKLSPLAQAQARADKLRAYKADLQKVKKEKEDEAVRRLEALKLERQKRIAARSSSAAHSPSTQQKKTQIQGNMSPSIHRGSKFSDSPGSPSPLQRLPVRASTIGSASRSDARKQAVGNGVSRSVSSYQMQMQRKPPLGWADQFHPYQIQRKMPLPELRLLPYRAKGYLIQKAFVPKVGDRIRDSSLKSVRGDQAQMKSSSDEPQPKSTIANLDDSKYATLPEVTLMSVTGAISSTTKDKSAVEDPEQEGNERKHLATSGEAATKKVGRRYNSLAMEMIMQLLRRLSSCLNMRAGENETFSGYAAIRAPPSTIVKCEVNTDVTDSLLDHPAESGQVSVEKASDKPYQSPYAQATPLESDYTKARLTVSSENASTMEEISKVYVPHSGDPSVEQEYETVEKPRSRESLKGFKKLLKFGRKSHGASPSEPTSELDSSSADDHTPADASSGEGHPSKGDKSGTPPTPSQLPSSMTSTCSRHFSILSPFRSKSSEKKFSAA
ncbi:unnamed protein product [Spirodela intermedia]|uniref:Uncharacterized protein n=1 Tax=Spirodela intermedia TaxID=51605 RepID=A0A7I8JSV8_SPIIN|nr:unnamed protein product [Spirodela intermedia]CAA6673270.1 unnamed protein product [Spirodela intermedia]